jgi:antitoxin (DNA-binding transcriptional repressor) of toxin-antitoxin stability system
MDVPIEKAEGYWAELVERAERGEEIVFVRNGLTVAQLGPANPRPQLTPEQRRLIIDEIVEEAKGKGLPGPDAAHASDHLYDEYGLPW